MNSSIPTPPLAEASVSFKRLAISAGHNPLRSRAETLKTPNHAPENLHDLFFITGKVTNMHLKKLIGWHGLSLGMTSAFFLLFAPAAQSFPTVASESMLPTFTIGETIIPQFGNLLPTKLLRGDIVVYRDDDPTPNWTNPTEASRSLRLGKLALHRVLGLPGETISYSDADRRWLINGRAIPAKRAGTKRIDNANYDLYVETLDGRSHQFLEDPRKPDLATLAQVMPRMQKPGACQIGPTSFRCTLPPGYAFIIGDNRGHSLYGLIPIASVVATVSQP